MGVGHETVAIIAYDQMKPAVRKSVIDILKSHPHFVQHFISGLGEKPDLNSEIVQRHIFGQAATWPDWVRPGPLQPNKEISKYHRGEWHYVNYPYVLPKDAQGLPKMPSNVAIGDGEILARLTECAKVVADKHVAAQERAVMLAWFFHLVGDLHQPLHAAALITQQLPKGDHGGNGIGVRNENGGKEIYTLHSKWDTLLGTDGEDIKIGKLANSIELAFGIATTPKERSTKRPELKLPELKSNISYESWAQESLSIAVSSVYLKGALRYGAPPARFGEEQPDPETVPVLPAKYLESARDIARARIGLAGCRLCLGIERMLQ